MCKMSPSFGGHSKTLVMLLHPHQRENQLFGIVLVHIDSAHILVIIAGADQ